MSLLKIMDDSFDKLKTRDYLKAMGDVKDFLEWLGCDKFNFAAPSDFKKLPVFGRLKITFELHKTKRGRWQAMVRTGKNTAFIKRFTTLVGYKKHGKCDAVLTALLALWELETYRKLNAVKAAFGLAESAMRPRTNRAARVFGRF